MTHVEKSINVKNIKSLLGILAIPFSSETYRFLAKYVKMLDPKNFLCTIPRIRASKVQVFKCV